MIPPADDAPRTSVALRDSSTAQPSAAGTRVASDRVRGGSGDSAATPDVRASASDTRRGSAGDEGAGEGPTAEGTTPTPRATATEQATPGPSSTPTLTSPPSETPTVTPAPSATDTPLFLDALPDGIHNPPPPFLRLGRPFLPANDVGASATYPYGSDGGGWLLLHHGLDLGAGAGVPVTAIADGQVVYAGDDSADAFGPQLDFYGNLVVVRHGARLDGRNLLSLYGHLATVNVAQGDVVREADELGTVGGTGIALGPHLHLEIRDDVRDYGRTFNPALFTRPREGAGAIAGRRVGAYGRAEPGITVALFRESDEAGAGTTWIAETRSYLWGPINRTSALQENFTFPDLPAGRYVVERVDGGPRSRASVRVEPGALSVVTLRPGQSNP